MVHSNETGNFVICVSFKETVAFSQEQGEKETVAAFLWIRT